MSTKPNFIQAALTPKDAVALLRMAYEADNAMYLLMDEHQYGAVVSLAVCVSGDISTHQIKLLPDGTWAASTAVTP